MAKETAIKEELKKDVKTKDTREGKEAKATPVKAAVFQPIRMKHAIRHAIQGLIPIYTNLSLLYQLMAFLKHLETS